MIKTRLMALLSQAKKYIIQNVFWQWAALLAQIAAVFSAAGLLESAFSGKTEGSVLRRTVLILVLSVCIRFVCDRMAARASYAASVDVKRILRKKIYEKLLRLGASYREQTATSEIVQMSSEGVEQLDKIICIDQSPIGRTPRSNPATYTGLFDQIRKIFAASPEAKARGYKENRFSFNVKGGRCENCCGDGMLKIEMHFLPDIFVPCDVCKGKRYNRETLEVTYKGKNISDVLDMNIEEAITFFENHESIRRKLETLYDVGLGYMKLGQASTTLSGGEAQRVKLATELSRRATGKTLYVLDEPTTGLHMADVDKLIGVLQRLTETGNSVLVIEHNLDVIKVADYLIDLGPEGGDKGGEIVCEGTPEEVAACEKSYTGQFLKKMLGKR